MKTNNNILSKKEIDILYENIRILRFSHPKKPKSYCISIFNKKLKAWKPKSCFKSLKKAKEEFAIFLLEIK